MNNIRSVSRPRYLFFFHIKILFLSLGLISSSALFGSENSENMLDEPEQDLFNLGIAYQSTSDDLYARTHRLSYRNHRREWFWPWQEATSRNIDWGIDIIRREGEHRPVEYESIQAQGTLGAYLAPGVYLRGAVGRHKLATDLGDETLTTDAVTALLGQGSKVTVEFSSSKDFVYPGGVVPGGITQRLSARDYMVAFRLRPAQELRITGKGTYRKFSDDNFSRLAEINLLYGISPSWPWVWAGVGGQQLSYSQQVASYWSPSEFKAIGLRFESSFPLGTRLSGSATANLDWLDEDGSEGKGYYLAAGLQYRLSGQLYARLELNQTKSLQRASTWTSDSALLWLSGPLF